MPRRGVQPWYSLGTRVNTPFFKNLRQKALEFRAEKRSAQVSAHPLSQAQGELFCDCVVCH